MVTGVTVLDPDTGATRWTDDQRSARLLPDGRLLLAEHARPAAGAVSHAAIVAPATGRQMVQVDGWEPITGVPGLFGSSDTGGSSFAVLNGDVLRRFGHLPVDYDLCQATPVYLVCPTGAGQLAIWHYKT